MSVANALHFLAWLREQLVRELLWGAWRHVLAREGAAQDRAFARFEALVNAAPCDPCRVEYMHPARWDERVALGLPVSQLLWIGVGALEEDFAW